MKAIKRRELSQQCVPKLPSKRTGARTMVHTPILKQILTCLIGKQGIAPSCGFTYVQLQYTFKITTKSIEKDSSVPYLHFTLTRYEPNVIVQSSFYKDSNRVHRKIYKIFVNLGIVIVWICAAHRCFEKTISLTLP